uniref:Uncharacterized protein n=1 Tax=Anguilla anguilla TaxID=7936 RepID=A0A0E9X8K7_ANGAN
MQTISSTVSHQYTELDLGSMYQQSHLITPLFTHCNKKSLFESQALQKKVRIIMMFFSDKIKSNKTTQFSFGFKTSQQIYF